MAIVKQWLGIDDFQDLFQGCIARIGPVHDISDHLPATEGDPDTAADPEIPGQTFRHGIGEGFVKRRNDCYFRCLQMLRFRSHDRFVYDLLKATDKEPNLTQRRKV